MENNEIMNEGIEAMVEEVAAVKAPNKGTGKTVAIVTIVTLAVGAGVALVKKVYDKNQAKKELHLADKEIEVEAEDLAKVVAE